MQITYGPILVVDDIISILELVAVTLRFKGYPVVKARNGQEALEKALQETPALVITDILMPKMDGYSLAQALRTTVATKDVPIIFLSATYTSPDDRQFALALGAASFIEKPFDTENLLLTVAEVLMQAEQERIHPPMNEKEFNQEYYLRLEKKLQHKMTQIGRTERLLSTLPQEQKPPFELLLKQSITDRNEIQNELNRLFKQME